MAFIYDLDNEYGGHILSDSGTGAPALQVNSNAAGQPAIAVYSTASGAAVKVTQISGGAAVDLDGAATDYPVLDVRSGATTSRALDVGRTVKGTASIAPFRILGQSAASAALMGFGGGFISITSILTTSAAHFDYALPVEVNGEARYIPLIKASGLSGGAAF